MNQLSLIMKRLASNRYIISLLVTLLLSPELKSQVLVQDSLALVDFFNSTGGSNWTNNSNWLNGPVGSWFGIGIGANRVVAIDLTGNNLSGSIPASFGDLTAMFSIDLDDNNLTGTIPSSLGNLAELQYLSIILNKLSGPIPPELGNLSQLVWIRLSNNEITGSLPASLGNLSNLRHLQLGSNWLTGSIPSSFGNMNSMFEMLLYHNNLSGEIPASLGNLVNMNTFIVDHNQLSGHIPAAIAAIGALRNFTVINNLLSGPIPAEFAQRDLLNFFLSDNRFTFDGMEMVAQKNVWQKMYAPQALLPIHSSCNKLWVSAGGTPANNTYRWYNENGILQSVKQADSTFMPSGPGSFYVVVSNKIATGLTLYSETIDRSLHIRSIDEQLCAGQTYTLPTGRVINTAGKYYDTLRAKSGCNDSLITILTIDIVRPVVKAVSAVICEGETYRLPTGQLVNETGIFNDILPGKKGCDSIIYTTTLVVKKALQTANSVVLCDGQSYRLPSGVYVTAPGVYYDTVKSVLAGCDSIVTALSVVADHTTKQIKDSLALCTLSSSITLDTKSSYPVFWNTGTASGTITVQDPGIYTATVQSAGGCTAYDTFYVVRSMAATFALDQHIVICGNEGAVIDAGNGFQNYAWNNGDNTQSIKIHTTGTYSVTVADRYHCTATGLVAVTKTANPPTGFLPVDTSVCFYGNTRLNATPGFSAYQWATGETTSSIIIQAPGIYTLRVRDSNGCTGTDDIVVKEADCTKSIFIPDIFSPNNDGLNDGFCPLMPNTGFLSNFRFQVFNRFGQKVFESMNPTARWDGAVNGLQQPTGVYIWMLMYQYTGTPLQTKKGTVVLIR